MIPAWFVDKRIGNDRLQADITNLKALWTFKLADSDFSQLIALLVFEINSQPVTGLWIQIKKSQRKHVFQMYDNPKVLANRFVR